MVKKSISAALLMVMMVWAELALAPMLFMHAGPMHAAREMSERMAAHHHAMPAGHQHPCCPGIGKTENTAWLEFAATSLPCQDEHRCCLQQGPQSVPAPIDSRASQAPAPPELASLSPAPTVASHLPPTILVALGPPPDQFGMILRV
jgi:hypothetical protein